MVERQKDPCRVTLKDVRLSYPQLFKARAFGKGKDGEPAFSASFLIDKDSKIGQANIAAVDDAIYEAKIAKWGSKDKFPKFKDDKICFHDGDDDEDAPEKQGMMVLSARNYKKPRVLDRDKQDVVEADGIVYGGCYVDAIVRIWAQDNEWGKRINCSLEGVRFRRDGEAFGAAPFDPDEFEDLDDDERPSRSRRSREDDDDRPSRRSRDDDDERPSRRSRNDDDDDAPRSRRGRDDEDDAPRSRRSREDEDDAPRSRRSREDDDERPRRGRDDEERASRRNRDDDDERPSRRGRDDDEDRPRRSSRDDDDAPRSRRSRDDDERPSRRSRNDDVV